MALVLTSLTLFPVKSCAPVPVNRVRIALAGPEWDREWMIVGKEGHFVTQREIPRLALVQPHLDLEGGALSLGPLGQTARVEVPLRSEGKTLEVEIWGKSVPALYEGLAASTWLSDFIGTPLHLVRITPANRRYEGNDPRTVRFMDSYPLHLCSLSTLADLNARLSAPLEMQRFRPNLVVSGAVPWAEDDWKSISIAGSRFRFAKRCERCPITTVDPLTALKGFEPLKTLAGFRRNARNQVEFGQYLHSVPGAELAVGMEVTPDLS